ncbi:hypothetical protein TKV_c02540 [Thermoanaerobacter kivui]|uniref:Uncharacterized protein n=1 Tax=Thermoanaerobacter kivui TaxID=2325 RepID=A0A097ANQ4_THEKI|nr:hypothetical protein [Thermoanaerobacter kivui]AIS51459.1 hypothetical protein TKV_c02540 [Thermoanaerobacter kivui]
MFKELKDVVKFLKENGINNQKDRRDIIEAFNPGAEVIELNKDVVVYRYYGGNSNTRGRWLTTELLSDPVNELALPHGNM